MDFGLKGAHVLVTGASGGIGLETTQIFLAQGANITAHYNSQRAPLLPLLEQYGPGRVHLAQADLVSEEEVTALFSSASNALGPIEVAVVNHGYYPSAHVPLAEMELSQWRATHDTNLTSSFLVCRAFLRGLTHLVDERKHCASIILVGSTAGKFGEAGHADYASTKSAIMYALTRTLKNEIVKIAPGARVNCVAPGWTRTPMAAAALADGGNVYRALATTPLKKVATPADVGNQIAVLASPVLSGHVSGQVVMVEGGMEGRLLNMPEDIKIVNPE